MTSAPVHDVQAAPAPPARAAVKSRQRRAHATALTSGPGARRWIGLSASVIMHISVVSAVTTLIWLLRAEESTLVLPGVLMPSIALPLPMHELERPLPSSELQPAEQHHSVLLTLPEELPREVPIEDALAMPRIPSDELTELPEIDPAPAPATLPSLRPRLTGVANADHSTARAEHTASTEQTTGASRHAPSDAPAAPSASRAFAPPVAISRATPDYPAQARSKGIEGTVRVLFVITAEGGVREVSVLASSGHAQLDQAAVAAVRTWRFQPRPEAPDLELTSALVFRLH